MIKTCFLYLFTILLLAAIPLVSSSNSYGQTSLGPKDGAGLPPADLERIKIGETAPDFTLENYDEKVITLSDFRDKKSVVLVFYRGYW